MTEQAFHQIRELGSIQKVLDVESTKILVHVFISSHLDYCNALLFGLPHYLLERVQYVQNIAASLIAQKRNLTMLLRFERPCTGFQLNIGLILKY